MATSLVWLLLPLLCHGIAGQQLMYARDQRSLYELPPLDWNTVGSFSPIGLGHMTKDELLTLLEAWQDVEAETATPAPEPAETPAPPTKRPRTPAPEPAEAGPALAPGRPVTVRLPALVPVQLAAMFTPPLAGGGGGGVGIADAAEALGAAAPADIAATELDLMAQSQEDAAPRLFQFTQLPMMAAQQRSRPAQPPPVVRNTLESVDTGIAPLANLVKAKSLNARPKATPIAKESPIHQGPPLRSRFSMPPLPYVANAPGRLELVPSSQIIGDWRE
ncbi:PREDICTED: predicted GPI-anchored protein 58 [Drosophila arizonae]|uniref:Predicted GPI-anchored protein 58 n=1 Tax=Drosophila arizonae TaxID=7263 RepID=A0ABM1PRH2_DROAR|nr:PREDICTED: predicted GPI-anchored protein 58 [Drosophila arizonae]